MFLYVIICEEIGPLKGVFGKGSESATFAYEDFFLVHCRKFEDQSGPIPGIG